jgi:hypothetical protein
MAVDGVNKVRTDGRYKLPTELAQKYEGEFLAAYEKESKIVLKVVDKDG